MPTEAGSDVISSCATDRWYLRGVVCARTWACACVCVRVCVDEIQRAEVADGVG